MKISLSSVTFMLETAGSTQNKSPFNILAKFVHQKDYRGILATMAATFPEEKLFEVKKGPRHKRVKFEIWITLVSNY